MSRLASIIRRAADLQFLRFVAVGVLNTLFGYCIYLGGLFLGLAPALALGIATVIGAVFNYFSTGRIVFRQQGLSRLPLFLGAYAVIYIVNALAIQGLRNLGIPPALAQGGLLPIVALGSFLIFRLFIFRAREETNCAV